MRPASDKTNSGERGHCTPSGFQFSSSQTSQGQLMPRACLSPTLELLNKFRRYNPAERSEVKACEQAWSKAQVAAVHTSLQSTVYHSGGLIVPPPAPRCCFHVCLGLLLLMMMLAFYWFFLCVCVCECHILTSNPIPQPLRIHSSPLQPS